MALKVRKNTAPTPPCPLAACMSLLKGAWTPNVIWYLRGGARRFGELRRDIPKVSAKVLTVRLRAMEERGVITRNVIASSPPSVEYALTELGKELIPVLDTIVKVSDRLALAARGRTPRRA